MPYTVALPDGRTVQFPDDVPQEKAAEILRQQFPAPAPSTERTWGEAIKDVPASLLTGAGSLLQAPGQLAKLVPGLKGVGEALEAPGEAVKQFGTDLKSAGLKAREALRSQAISDAEKDGILSEFATAITSTIKDPALITSFITEQVPLLLGPLGAARLTTKLGMGAVEGAAAGAAREAAAAKLGQKATTAAIGTGTAMQAADVSGNTYDTALKRALEMGMSQQEAEDAALNAARISAGGAAAVSLGASVGLGKLGGAAIERRLAGLPGQGRIQSGIGEATSETLEEAGGQVFQNVGVRTVDPSQSLTQGVGSAAAMGALGGGFFGSMLGKRPEADLAPGQLPGESLYDTAARINRDIKTVDDLAKAAETDQARTQSGLMTNTQLVDMYREQGYGAVKQYQQQLLDQAADPSLPREQKTAAREAAQQIQELFKQVDQEEVSRRAKAEVSNIITDKDVTINLGIPRKDPLYQQLVNKNIGRPEDAEAVIQALESALSRKGLRQTQYERFNTALAAVNEYLATIPGSGFYARPSVQQPSGASPVVASVPSADTAPTGGGTPQPSGVVPAEPDAAQPVSRKAEPTTPVMEDDITPQKAEEVIEEAPAEEAPKEVQAAKPAPAKNRNTPESEALFNEIKALETEQLGLLTKAGKIPAINSKARTRWDDLDQQIATKKDQWGRMTAALPAAAPAPQAVSAPPAAAPLVTPAVSYLPKDLAGAKPRYAYGEKAFQLQFNSDIDKALYITAQKTPSKRDADYRAWLEKQGFTPDEVAQGGQRVRSAIKNVAAKAEPADGPINLPEQVKKPTVKRSLAPELEKQLEPIYQDLERRAKAPKKDQPKAAPAKAAPKEDTQRDLLMQRRAELVKQLDGILKKILAKYNLTGVTLNLEEGMAEEGSYSGQIIKLALNLENPVRVLRHESIHALKDMGFFSDAQWKTLVKKAQDEWVQKYLKDREHSATQSRYDAYVDLLTKEGNTPTQVEEAIIEEAIADAFGDFDVNGAPPGLMAAIHRRMKALFKAIKEAFGQAGIDTAEEIFGKIEKGSLKPEIPVGKKESGQFNAWKATDADIEKADAYEEKNGIKPYLSEGRLDLPTKYSIKSNVDKYGEDPILGIPLNKDGTVTVYYHTVKPNVFKLNTSKTIPAEGRDRIYLTNESSGAKVYNKRGNFDQDIDGSVVLLNINPSLLQIDQEYDDGRKDFFVPLTQGSFFNKKMQAAAIQAPRTKAIAEEFSYKDHQERIAKAIEEYNGLTGKEKQARLNKARNVLKREHNIGTLMTENGKLEKTRMGDYGLLWDGKPIDSMGLGLASAQQISEKLSTCPNSAICEGLCLGETSGGNFFYGGAAREDVVDIEKSAFRAGPRMVQYLKTEALIINPEEFAIVLQSEIDTLKKWDNSPTYKKKNKETGKLETIDKDVYQSAVRLNVTSDFKPEMWSSLIDANPEVMFYDYTKLVGNTPIAPNHHLTYSSTGFGQTIDGEDVFFKTKSGRYDHNWPQVRNRLNASYNVAMAFSSKSALPKTLVDEETGTTYKILDGDDYDARFLDEMSPLKQEGLGVIVGLRNKALNLKEKTAAKETDGFFADYDPKRDGDSITVPNQTEFGAPAYKAPGKTIPISKKSLRSESPQFKFWFGQSKIVDEDGKPKVMYHGTARDITEFKPKQANAIFVTDDPRVAGSFAGASEIFMVKEMFNQASPEQRRKWTLENAKIALDDGYITKKDYEEIKRDFDYADITFSLLPNAVSDAVYEMLLLELPSSSNILPLYVKAEYPFDFDNEDHIAAIQAYETANRYTDRTISNYIGSVKMGSWEAIESKRVQDAIRGLGFDSFYVKEAGRKNLAVYNPEQIKSATGNIGTFDPANPDIRKSLRSPIGLYSELESKVEAVSSKAAPAGQWKAMINAMTQKGVKPEEIEWSGVNDWLDLQGGKVNKDDLLDYLKNNGVQVEETVLGERDRAEAKILAAQDIAESIQAGLGEFNDDAQSMLDRWRSSAEGSRIESQSAAALEEMLSEAGDNRSIEDFIDAGGAQTDTTKYGQYTLPGGENYREVLLTLPIKKATGEVRYDPAGDAKFPWAIFVNGKEVNRSSDEKTAPDILQEEIERASKKADYKSSHWDQPNVLAHIRVNDRTDADGNKVLFVEEIQSDWGQEGKKKGFASDKITPVTPSEWQTVDHLNYYFDKRSEADAKVATLPPAGNFSNADLDTEEYRYAVIPFSGGGYEIVEQAREVATRVRGLSPAPFVTKTEGWLNLALKRIMIMAAEGDYDKVAFVNGDQSADRYDLSRSIDRIDAKRKPNGTYEIDVSTKDGKDFNRSSLTPEELEDNVGKEMAQKIIDATASNQERVRFSGLDLKVGGEGMRTFYDKIVPTTLKKLLPKVGGGQMGTTQIESVWTNEQKREINNAYARGTSADVERVRKFTKPLISQPGFDVTPAMREKIEATGLPKFSLRSTLPASAINAMDKIAPPRYEPGYAERIMNAVTGDTFTSIRQKLVNRYEALAVLDRRVAKTLKQMGGATQLASSRAETAALMSDLGAGVLEAAMGVHDRVGGAPIFRNGVTTVSNYGGTVKGLLEIFKPIAAMKDADAFRLYQTWAAVKRGKRLTVEGREDLIDAADIRAIDSLTRTNKDMIKMFEQVQKEWTAYNNALVKYQVDTGVISPTMAKEWTKHGDYFPFYRLMEGEDIAGPKVFSSIGNVSIGKKLKGGEDPLGDFFENIVRNSQAAIQAGMKNVAAQAATNQALIINEVTRLNRKPQSHESVYRVYENGKEVYYRANDPLFIEAIKALNMADLPFMGLLSKPAAMLRNLVTKDPAFMLANMMRDSLSAWATTGIKMTPIIDTLNNFGKAIAGKSPELDALYAAGVLGGYDYARGTRESADVFATTLRRRSGQMTPFEVGTKPFTSLWEALEKGTQASDAATRMEVYKKTLDATGNELEALSAALEVMNFNRKGNSAIVRVLTAAVPFLNARIQGLDILFRTAIMPLGGTTSDESVQRMKTFWVRGMTIMALSSMYWLLTHDDEEYKKQEQETRDNNWLLPSLGVKIPIPFEVGVLFKVIPERLMQLSFGTDTTTDFTDAMKRQFLSTFAFNLVPQVALPLYEVKTNYSFFTDRPIIGKGLENVVDKYQVGPSTSRVAQMIGEAVGYSPMKTDYLIKGYFGTIGSYASDLFDMMYDMGADSPKASKRFEQLPIIKRFAVDPDARGTVTAYYKFKDQVDQAVRTANLLERSNNFEEGTSYTVENLRLLASDSYVKDVEKSLKDYREMKQQIMSMPLSADTKRDLLLNASRMESLTTANIQSIKKFAQ